MQDTGSQPPTQKTPNPIPCNSPETGLPSPGSSSHGGNASLTYLDPHETSDGSIGPIAPGDRSDPRLNLLLNFRHSFWKIRRASTYSALKAAFNCENSLFGADGNGYVSSFSSSFCNVVGSSAFPAPDLASSTSVAAPALAEIESVSGYDLLHNRAISSLAATGLPGARCDSNGLRLPHDDTTPLRLLRFAQCGSDAWVLQSLETPPRFRVVSNRCRDRFCEACQRERRNTVSNNVALTLKDKSLRLLTLTLKSSGDPLRFQLNRLYKSFRLFRSRKGIRSCLFGGLFFLEVTLNDQTRMWHPHLHVIYEGQYLPQKLAANVWLSVTSDSYIVDVRALSSSDSAADYVSKYASKGISQRVWQDPERFVEAIIALSGRRTFSVFGTWRGLGLSATPRDSCDWVYFGRLDDVIILARSGDTACLEILGLLLTRTNLETVDYARSPPTDEAR